MAPKLTGFPGKSSHLHIAFMFLCSNHGSLSGNARVRRVLAAAALAGVSLEHDKSFSFKSNWKTPEFLEKFPLGYLPVLEDGDLYLSESGAIAEYGELGLYVLFCSQCSGVRGMAECAVEGERRCLHDESYFFSYPCLN